MALIGLSIVIATLSFLCYRHAPASWSYPRWLQKAQPRHGPKLREDDDNDHRNRGDVHEKIAQAERPPLPPIIATPTSDKTARDRRAMPPPPLLAKPSSPSSTPATPPSPPDTPKAVATKPSIAATAYTLEPSRPRPSFPAANSAQRVSTTPASNAARRAPASLSSSSSSYKPQATLRTPAPLPNRNPGLAAVPMPSRTASSLLPPPPSSAGPPARRRGKIQLSPGHSPLDWAALCSSSPSLSGLPADAPYLRVPPSLLKRFDGRRGRDAWTVLGGRVYNVSPYLPYHPGGGPELLRCAGADGSRLFADIHPWVNWEGMLEACLVGVAVTEDEVVRRSALDDMD
ncbi:MAG: hypothetical protein M1818_001346 [Claussenomyces sp. TS43310]|nr:MAG: hypothetical protein M1818_001346 [Claussenomyces sp. TS43310]